MNIKSSADIRKFLLEQMSKVASGEQDILQAKAVCNYAQAIYNTINLEVKIAIATAKNGADITLKPVVFDDSKDDNNI